ncbi:hypothetical protein AVEN_14312-1 [Araneus ventricosus]|uniref:Uncharacterized protein n=1 Tax=Araneus ventricosus TaxID=182803 RepID=A0A4Y2VEY8_ARAVE|nr:hypothetical protein AVEN_14312-1 [Araneus ventricosus]
MSTDSPIEFRIHRDGRGSTGVVWKFEEGEPAQVSSSSFDRSSKVRGQSPNSPRVASKWHVNITELNFYQGDRNDWQNLFLYHRSLEKNGYQRDVFSHRKDLGKNFLSFSLIPKHPTY